MKDLTSLDEAAIQAVEEAGLRFTSDSQPGIQRKKRGRSFCYFSSSGICIRDPKVLGRIRRLAIPPAWTNVWICTNPNGHLQATGRDARGRKQYRYHPDFRALREENKFERILGFAKVLPRIRQRVEEDLKLPGLPREKVLACVVRLLERTLVRVGNEEYARSNRSYGLTTLRNHHARIRGNRISFIFRGKSGVRHQVELEEPRLARLVKRCQELPGQEIFTYEAEDGTVKNIGSQEVNDYLREIAGENYTAKDFRTWAGTTLAAVALTEFEEFESQRAAKKNITKAIEAVSKMLGNTPSICRKCYVHPAILESYLKGSVISYSPRVTKTKRISSKRLNPDEAAVVSLLQKRVALAAKAAAKNNLQSALAASLRASKSTKKRKRKTRARKS